MQKIKLTAISVFFLIFMINLRYFSKLVSVTFEILRNHKLSLFKFSQDIENMSVVEGHVMTITTENDKHTSMNYTRMAITRLRDFSVLDRLQMISCKIRISLDGQRTPFICCALILSIRSLERWLLALVSKWLLWGPLFILGVEPVHLLYIRIFYKITAEHLITSRRHQPLLFKFVGVLF